MKTKITDEDYELTRLGRAYILGYMDSPLLTKEFIMAGRALNVFHRWPNTDHSYASISIVFHADTFDSDSDEYGLEVNLEIWDCRLSVSIEPISKFVVDNFNCGTVSRKIDKNGMDEGYIDPAELDRLANYMFVSGGYVRINDDETTSWSEIVSNLWNFDGSPIEDAFDDLSFVEGDFLGFVYSSGYPELANALKDTNEKGQAMLQELYKSPQSDLLERRYEHILGEDENIMVGKKQIWSPEIFCRLVDDYIRKECEKNLLLQSKWLAESLNGELGWHQAMQWKYAKTTCPKTDG